MNKLISENDHVENKTDGSSQSSVYVRMLGEFSITCGNVSVSNARSRSMKTWLLLAYLLCNRGRMIPRDELVRLLGENENNAGTGSALRMTRLRTRRILEPLLPVVGKELLLGKDGSVAWNPEVLTELDTEQFESYCRLGAEETDAAKRLAFYRKALSLYRGGFLEKLSGEAWVGPLTANYQRLYLDTLEEALPLLYEAGFQKEALSYFREAVKFAPYEEGLYAQLMRGLLASGEYAGAENAYQSLYQLLSDDLGVEPSDELQELYLEILQHRNGDTFTPDRLMKTIQEETVPTGAMVCDFNVFRLFYHEEVRSSSRRGDAVHIGLFTVEGKHGADLDKRALGRAMKQLCQQIHRTLRIGDIVASCSPSQYVVLLVQANYENSHMVCRRVIRAFEKAHPRSPAMVQSTVIPLETRFDKE